MLASGSMQVQQEASLGASARSILTRGWVMVAVSFVVQGLGLGCQYANFVLIQPLQDKFHGSTATILFCTTGIGTLFQGLGSPLCGMALQRYSIRSALLVSMLSSALGYWWLAYASELWQVAVLQGLLLAIGGLTATLAGNMLVANWFLENRGLALGIASAGVLTAGVAIPPAATWAIDVYGLSTTCLLLGLMSFCTLPVVAWLVIDRPECSESSPASLENQAPIGEWTLRRILTSRTFWIITTIATLISAVVYALMSNLMLLAQAHGTARQAASWLLSTAALSGIVGAVLYGRVFDAMGQRISVRLLIALVMAGCILLMGNPSYISLMIAVVLVGISAGSTLLLPSVLTTANFGRSGFAMAYGAANPFIVVFIVAAISAFGRAYDVQGTYDGALEAFLAILALVFLSAQFLGKRSTAPCQ